MFEEIMETNFLESYKHKAPGITKCPKSARRRKRNNSHLHTPSRTLRIAQITRIGKSIPHAKQ